jgi:hypothetical protein
MGFARDQLEAAVRDGLKSKRAGIAGANDLGNGHLKQVAVFGSKPNAAKFASPDGDPRPREAAQGGKDRLLALKRFVHLSKRNSQWGAAEPGYNVFDCIAIEDAIGLVGHESNVRRHQQPV